MVRIVTGNLLGAKVEALVNTVNTVGVMGKGIALQFRRAFDDNYKAYTQAAKNGQIKIGQMFVYDYGALAEPPRYIINFPTKEHWRSSSSLEFIEAGLQDLVRVIREYQIRSIAVPALGCSNGGLEWGEVRPLIERALGGLEGVEVLLFAPYAGTEILPLKASQKMPGLTIARAALLKMMSIYEVFGNSLGRLEAQKLAYLLQTAGVEEFKLRFEAAQFGPFAEPLNKLLLTLDGHYLEGYGDRSRPSHMYVRPEILQAIDDYLGQFGKVNESIGRVSQLIAGLESPYGMELITSLHWLAVQEGHRDLESAYRHLRQWNSRKAATFELQDVEFAWKRLVSSGWVVEQPSARPVNA